MKPCRTFVIATLGTVLLNACGGGSSAGLPARLNLGGVGRRVQERVLYSFQNVPDGANPYAGLLVGKNGEFYGTTYGGGGGASSGNGTVFEIPASGKEKVLYSFQYGNDGAGPQAPVIEDKSGALYGETDYGGGSTSCNYGCGVIYELTPSKGGYTERVLYAFVRGNDGSNPIGGLLDEGGALYGTTYHGGGSGACTPAGLGCGTVFKLTPSGSGYTESILHAFKGKTDGAGPTDELLADSKGNLYGTTLWGGETGGACKSVPSDSAGCGTVFRLTPSGSHYTQTVIYRFKGGTADGQYPRTGLLAGKNGVFYGLTEAGGSKNGGSGTVFELTPKGSNYTEQLVYAFKGGDDGADPDDTTGLYAGADGALYGSTASGGGATACSGGCGTIFKLTPSGSSYSESVLYAFQGGADGEGPYGSVVADAKGNLYGPTFIGGSGSCTASSGNGCGTIFKIAP
jgi:uncharacterized repeat protein (TIGR03803 family)